jgi:Tfp pilus assembly pilus retraction ATPase PilT
MITNISLLESKLNKKMKTLRSKSKFLEASKVAPIHTDYPNSNVGLMLFVGKMGSGKTNDVLKH